MTPQEIAERYADSMSVDANRELVSDIEDAIEAEQSRAEQYRADLKDLVCALWEGTTGIHTWQDTLQRARSIGTTPAPEPAAPLPPQSDYSEWKHTPEGQRELLIANCLAVANNPDNPAAVAELKLRLHRMK